MNVKIELIVGKNLRVYTVQWRHDKLERYLSDIKEAVGEGIGELYFSLNYYIFLVFTRLRHW